MFNHNPCVASLYSFGLSTPSPATSLALSSVLTSAPSLHTEVNAKLNARLDAGFGVDRPLIFH